MKILTLYVANSLSLLQDDAPGFNDGGPGFDDDFNFEDDGFDDDWVDVYLNMVAPCRLTCQSHWPIESHLITLRTGLLKASINKIQINIGLYESFHIISYNNIPHLLHKSITVIHDFVEYCQ